MTHRHINRCPGCGYGRLGKSDGHRYCPICKWSDKPKVDKKR